MRRIKWRSIIGGVFFMMLAVGFYFFMLANISMSTDPQEMMRLVGQLSGFVFALGVMLILIGLIGKKA
jgi:formate/nitrite transporter FocA (FNT family)